MFEHPADTQHGGRIHRGGTDFDRRERRATDEPRILKFDPHARKSRPSADEQILGQYIPLIYHYNMLQDEDRVAAFKSAIELVVRPGMQVLELGSGTGILSSFAARLGAKVWAVEKNPELVECSLRFISSNNLQNSIQVVHADAALWTPPARVDVVICEMLHVGLLREKQVQVISEFKKNYIAKFGSKLPAFVPEASILMCQPVYQDFLFEGYNAPVPMFQSTRQQQPRTTEIAPLQSYQMVQYDQPIANRIHANLSFHVTTSGSVNALRMVTQNVLTVDLKRQRAVTWPNQCLVMPLAYPQFAFEGDNLDLSLHYEIGQAIENVKFSFSADAGNSNARAAA